MPMYEYRCRTCGHSFEQLRTLGEADAAADCPDGHDDTVRQPSLIARPASGGLPLAGGGSPGGGCCGGGCCA